MFSQVNPLFPGPQISRVLEFPSEINRLDLSDPLHTTIFLIFQISFWLIHYELPCWNWYSRKFLIFRALFAEKKDIFFSGFQQKSFYHSIFFSANLALQVRFTNLGTVVAGSFCETYACAVKCRPPRLFQQGKSSFWKIKKEIMLRGEVKRNGPKMTISWHF